MQVADSDDAEDRSLLIAYATETGNAQDAADYIARQCRRIAFQCRVVNIEQIPLLDLAFEGIVIFIVSTTGYGVEPRSMTPLWNDLLRELSPDTFEDFSFAVFGLGDTSYEKFCWAAKKLSRRLQSLGALEFYQRGEGDEQHPLGIDGALKPWTDGLIATLVEHFPLPPGVVPTSVNDVPPPRVLLKAVSKTDSNISEDPLKADLQYHKATIKMNERITASDWYQDVRHIIFGFEDDINYNPGDVAVIHPSASDSDTDAFLSMMKWESEADELFAIEQSMFDQSLPDHLPTYATMRTLFSRFLDFNAVPRRSFFQFIRHFTSDEREKEKLDEFLTTEGAEDLYDYCYKVRRTIQEVLDEFRHVKIPRDYIFDAFPALRPREFSIASSVKKHPREIHLCVAIVKYRTKLKVPRKGVCTSYLSTLKPGDNIQVGIKKGLLKLPENPATPVICVGPGTGIAPMRSVIEQRIDAGARLNVLYFGCRSSSKDQHFGDEWKSYENDQSLQYRTAFSRDGPEGVKRIYVQDLIRDDAEHVWRLVGEQQGSVLISGSSNKMPAAVREAIAFAVETHGARSAEEAKQYVHLMIKEGRLIEECWS